MAFQRYNRFSVRKPYQPYKSMVRNNGQLTRKFQSKINRTVQRLTPRQRKVDKNGGGNPPMFTTLKGMTRTVRIQVTETATGVHSNQIFETEASYYGITDTIPKVNGGGISRWTSYKVLSFKAYGHEGVSKMELAVALTSAESNVGAFSDYSNNNDRPVISVEMPASTPILRRNQTQVDLVTFGAANTCEIIDFYVQFH